MSKIAGILIVSLCCLPGTWLLAQESHTAKAEPEFRALWVDAFHAGIRTPQEADKLVEDAAAAHFNALIVQVRRRGDSLYHNSIEPPLREAPYDPGFDALAYVIEKAHARGLEVHAWVNAMPIWKDPAPPPDANHVYHLHGPEKTGADNWLTASPQGNVKFPVGYFLDAGHPAAADYVARVCAQIVKHYKVDGLHLDYIRYPETLEEASRGAAVGYNPVSVERFRKRGNLAGDTSSLPAPDDTQWIAWRRQQLTQLMRRIYIESKLVNPAIKVSAAVIAWGKPPLGEKDFENVAPMQRVFQDWHGWLQEGILDMSLPMNYAREHNPVVREWFNGWIAWEKEHKHGRQMIIGLGSYLNRPQATLAQIERIRAAKGKSRADGVSLFSYNSLATRLGESIDEVLTIQELQEKSRQTSGPFATPAPVPVIKEMQSPQRGWLLGKAVRAGIPWDGGSVTVKRSGWFQRTRTLETDGNGYFGLTGLKPGSYVIRFSGDTKRKLDVKVSAGKATFVEIAE